MGYMYARQIYLGHRTYDSVPDKYKEETRQAYYELYGVWL